ncbi:YdbH family protein [Franconibacter helveticus]|uniref:YdbH family protein n=1 Tax=Franconibacter helveticus TaxID=357240 RepID=UPI002908A32D|nr:YdbH family protein [Franconibacter helveticus]MDU6924051.1 YdbH family protein [Franconibacter helveticus]
MKGKYRAVIAFALLLILLPLTLVFTVGYWLPWFAGIWLPQGTRIALEQRPRLSRHAVILPDLRYLAGDCELAKVKNATLTHPSRWRLDVDALTINPACFSTLPAENENPAAPRTLAEWQSMLPMSWVTIKKLTLTPWAQYAGALEASLTPQAQRLRFSGEQIETEAQLQGQTLRITKLNLKVADTLAPVTLAGDFTLPLVPDGLPTQGHTVARLTLPFAPGEAQAELAWQDNRGQLLISAAGDPDPLLDLPWTLTSQTFMLSDGRWRWPYQGFPLSGRVALKAENWRAGLERAQISGRVNVVTEGAAGKGNAVMTFGPGRLSMTQSDMPLRINGEAKQDAMVFYAMLPAQLSGPLLAPQLRFQPGALLRSRGRVIDSLNIDEIRWPLAGVKLTPQGVDGRLQAILRAHEQMMGEMTLHMDGRAENFLPDAGLWRWRYWGDGSFIPMQARWKVAGRGEWRDSAIELTELATGFDKLQYGAMSMSQPRLRLTSPVRWERDAIAPDFRGALQLDADKTTFSGGSVLPPSTLVFSVKGRDPTAFQFKGDLRAQAIGPVRVNGRWDGERLRGQAWWPAQPLAVFQPLIPADWKMALRDGQFYAQVAFSAAAEQGFEAGGHGVVKNGSAWTTDNKINDVDFVLPFRYSNAVWQLGTRGPVRLRIGEIESQVTARNVSASLQGNYPWSEAQPLLLSNVSVEMLGGQISLQQLRMPQHDAALLRLHNLSASEFITATNVKQVALSGAVNGALPLWLENPQWIIKDGWLTNPGPLTLRLDKEMADAMAKDNVAAGAAINWLRYMEISRSWTRLTLDNLGQLTMSAELQGTSRIDGKSNTVRLNYHHQENLFTLWRSLRFGDNLQTWLEQHAQLPGAPCKSGNAVCEEEK